LAQSPAPELTYVPIGRVLGASTNHFAFADTIEIVGRRISPLPSPGSNLSGSIQPERDPQYRGSLLLTSMLRPHLYVRTRAERVIYGADRLAGASAAIGGLGMVGGLWGEKPAGYLMGAGAILGALWGGTIGSNDPGLRVGVVAEPRVLDRDRHSPAIREDRR
jgi:hypothetical protein